MTKIDDASVVEQAQQELDSLNPALKVSRRGFVASGLSVGFAAAVMPVGAQTITTPTDGLTAGEVKVTTHDNLQMPAYRAHPAGKPNAPVILVVQEIFGVHEHIKDICRRFAKAGYYAIAPEMYIRQGDPTKYTEIPKLFAEVVSKVPDEQVMRDLDACVAFAKGEKGDVSKLGVTGFCWGGRITWLYTAYSKNVKAGVAWYGRLVGNSTPLTPKHPVDVVGDLNAPVLGLYGDADTGIPMDTVERMQAALKTGSASAKASEFKVYKDAPHAFLADYRPSFRKDIAQDAWGRALAWFKANGVA